MLRTLRSKLLFYFLMVSLAGTILISSFIHLALHDTFSDYLLLKREEHILQVVELVERSIVNNGHSSPDDLVVLLHQQAVAEGIYYQIFDSDGSLVLDSTHMASMGMGMRNNQKTVELENMNLTSSTYPLKVGTKEVGLLVAIYQREYVDSEIHFLGSINRYLIGAALTMTVVGAIFSFTLSKRLTDDLNRMRDTARELQKHNLNIPIDPDRQQTEELRELADAFKDLAESLLQQEKLRKQFATDVAHELRTPLATLRSQLEAFQDGVWEPTHERIKQCHGELMRLVRLVNDLEKLLAAENPTIVLKKERINAREALNSLRQYFAPAFLNKGVELIVDEPAPELSFLADKDRLQQIMTNLIDNALKYTPSGGLVKITAYSQKEKVYLVVKDNGMGISQEDLPHIFERFYRGEKSRDRKTGGAGIGLSVVSALVQAHKGTIEVDSELGEGTTVTLGF